MKVIHNGEIEQVTFLDERFYFDEITKNYYPSVTTVLDVYPKGWGFQEWLKDLGSNANDVLKRAGEQGTHIHEGIQSFLNGGEIKWIEDIVEGKETKENFTLEEWLMILKFVEFYKTYKPVTIAVEVSLVDAELGYGATLDYVCTIPRYPGEIWYIDWKSGGSIWKTNKIQDSAYVELWNKLMPDQKITRSGCMHLRAMTRDIDKTGKQMQGKGWKLEEVTEEQEHLFKLFQHTQVIWKEENPNPTPKNMVYPDRISIEIIKKQEELNILNK